MKFEGSLQFKIMQFQILPVIVEINDFGMAVPTADL